MYFQSIVPCERYFYIYIIKQFLISHISAPVRESSSAFWFTVSYSAENLLEFLKDCSIDVFD